MDQTDLDRAGWKTISRISRVDRGSGPCQARTLSDKRSSVELGRSSATHATFVRHCVTTARAGRRSAALQHTRYGIRLNAGDGADLGKGDRRMVIWLFWLTVESWMLLATPGVVGAICLAVDHPTDVLIANSVISGDSTRFA